MAVSKYQKFEAVTINRTDITNAEWNPRIMGETQKKNLRKNLKTHGLVSPITWNKQTGHVVGGHQRLEQLDALEKSQDYELTVAVIDVDEREEAKINVTLNNPSSQGEWNLDALADMTVDFDIDMKDMGFGEDDIALLFGGNDKFNNLFEDSRQVQETKTELDEIKKNRKEYADKAKQDQSADFFFYVVCKNQHDKDELYKAIGVPFSEMYVTADQIRRLTKDNKGR